MLEYVAHRFTFGSDHRLPDGRPARNEFVEVIVPAALAAQGLHRTLFIEWLGSNAFSTEYDPVEWERISSRYYAGQSPAVTLSFTVTESA